MNTKTNIPSDDDFARASRFMEEQAKGLDQVSEAVTMRFKKTSPLQAFHILDQRDVDFRAYIFFEKESDIVECQNSGIIQAIIDCVYAELERVGRGGKEDVKVAFEIDSNENVTENYEGDYFLRLR